MSARLRAAAVVAAGTVLVVGPGRALAVVNGATLLGLLLAWLGVAMWDDARTASA